MTWVLHSFSDSAKELKKIRTIAGTGMLIALSIAVKTQTISITSSLRVSFAFLGLSVIAMLYGPVVAMFAGAITDLIGFFMSTSTFGFNPVWTIFEAIVGLIYGLLLYKAGKMVIPRIIFAQAAVNIFVHIGLNTWGLVYFFNVALKPRLVTSIIKNGILLPVEIALMIAILLPVREISRRVSRT
ncbi:MAG: folate family ECF transporter S component [Clostridiales bacterium]|nr:folate family ECF transporter S component [Clostridiales bacterium]